MKGSNMRSKKIKSVSDLIFKGVLIVFSLLIVYFAIRESNKTLAKEDYIRIIEITWMIQTIAIALFVVFHFVIAKTISEAKNKVLQNNINWHKITGVKIFNLFVSMQSWIMWMMFFSIWADLLGSYAIMFLVDDISNSRFWKFVITFGAYFTMYSTIMYAGVSISWAVSNNKLSSITQEDIEKLTASDKVLQGDEEAKQDNLPADAQEAAASVDDSKKKQEKADEVSEVKADEKEKTEETKEESKEDLKEEKEGKDGKKE